MVLPDIMHRNTNTSKPGLCINVIMVINCLNKGYIRLLLHNLTVQSGSNFHRSVRVMLLQLFL